MKTIFWMTVAIVWSYFEVLQMIFTWKVSKIGLFISNKLYTK